jgi:NAD(P)-dependent dehydrogenase (short-subunit alcohol dehydrogenase family)
MHTLVFGATGGIGKEVFNAFAKKGYATTGTSRLKKEGFLEYDPFNNKNNLPKDVTFDAICFAQGMNFNDNIFNVNGENHLEMYKANCLFIILAISELLANNSFKEGAKITIISSIWQEISRTNKLSYCTTKAALKGLVQSLSLELGNKGILVNAVLPGAIDNKMTRENLSSQQISTLCNLTPTQKLSGSQEIADTILFLSSPQNTNITNQFITIDGGFSHTKIF